MTDLEITKACAEAMGYPAYEHRGNQFRKESMVIDDQDGRSHLYDPLHDDAQAMALVKKFYLMITPIHNQRIADTRLVWAISWNGHDQNGASAWATAEDATLNRAICECVSRMVKK